MTIATDGRPTTVQQRMTLEEYLDYDDGTDTRYELEDGVLRTLLTSAPKTRKTTRSVNICLGAVRGPGLIVCNTISSSAKNTTSRCLPLPSLSSSSFAA